MKKYVIKTGGILILIFLAVLCALYFRIRDMNTTRILLVNNSSIPVYFKDLQVVKETVWKGTLLPGEKKKFRHYFRMEFSGEGTLSYTLSDGRKIFKGNAGYISGYLGGDITIVYDTDNNVYVYHLDDWKRYCTGLSPESPYGKKVCRCAGWKNTDWHYIQEGG